MHLVCGAQCMCVRVQMAFYNLQSVQLLSVSKLLYDTFHMKYIDTR